VRVNISLKGRLKYVTFLLSLFREESVRILIFPPFSEKAENTAVGIRHADQRAPLSTKVGTNFTDNQLSLSRYSSLVDSGHGV
jgi:hypothetical protein